MYQPGAGSLKAVGCFIQSLQRDTANQNKNLLGNSLSAKNC